MSLKKGNGTSTVSWRPFGVGMDKPNHYFEMARVFWENRDNVGYAWRILKHGVCDGCSLGPYGFRDDTMKGVHLCMTRLRMLRMNTMPALNVEILKDVDSLKKLSSEQMRNLGRLPYPMIRKKGDGGFHRISWDEALELRLRDSRTSIRTASPCTQLRAASRTRFTTSPRSSPGCLVPTMSTTPPGSAMQPAPPR